MPSFLALSNVIFALFKAVTASVISVAVAFSFSFTSSAAVIADSKAFITSDVTHFSVVSMSLPLVDVFILAFADFAWLIASASSVLLAAVTVTAHVAV